MRADPFPPGSRYNGVGTKELKTGDEQIIVCLKRRFVPPPERFALLCEHTVKESDRLDNITAQYLGDPEQFWRLCDANNAMDPEALADTAGKKIKITLPEGIPGPSNA